MKDERFQMMISKDEKEALSLIASDEYSSQAEVLRKLLRQEAKSRGYWPLTNGAITPSMQVTPHAAPTLTAG